MFNLFTALDGVLLEEGYVVFVSGLHIRWRAIHDKLANQRSLMLVLVVPEEALP